MPRAHRTLLGVLTLAFFCASGAAHADGSRHPQDGPDADVRMTIDDGRMALDIAMNLAFCDAVAPTAREDEWALPDEERPYVEETLIRFFRERLVVEVDGAPLELSRGVGVEIPPPDMTLLPLFPMTRTKGVINVGVALEYVFDGTPKSVRLVWPEFPESPIPGLGAVEINVQLVALGLASVSTLTVDEPGFTWHAPADGGASRFLEVPQAVAAVDNVTLPIWAVILFATILMAGVTVSRNRFIGLIVGFVGCLTTVAAATLDVAPIVLSENEAAAPTADEALAIFDPLHRNIYKAFDFNRESDIYDALARSVDGVLLDSLYDEVYQSLIMREEGGAVSRVEEVRYLDRAVAEIAAGEFSVRARWQVDGAVFHWGHAHERTNEHEADYTIVRTAAGWRIGASRMLEQKRVSSSPGEDG